MEQNVDLFPLFRDKGSRSGGVEIRSKESACGIPVPQIGPGLEHGNVFRSNRRLRDQPAVGFIVKRSDHPGDIPEWRALEPPLAERPRRLSLKVDDVEVVPGVEDLSQMIVSVDSDFQR